MRESNDKSRKSENAIGFLFGNVAQLFRNSYGPYGHFDQVGPSQVVNDSTVNSETLIENVPLQVVSHFGGCTLHFSSQK